MSACPHSHHRHRQHRLRRARPSSLAPASAAAPRPAVPGLLSDLRHLRRVCSRLHPTSVGVCRRRVQPEPRHVRIGVRISEGIGIGDAAAAICLVAAVDDSTTQASDGSLLLRRRGSNAAVQGRGRAASRRTQRSTRREQAAAAISRPSASMQRHSTQRSPCRPSLCSACDTGIQPLGRASCCKIRDPTPTYAPPHFHRQRRAQPVYVPFTRFGFRFL
jgi:hypothetical protein